MKLEHIKEDAKYKEVFKADADGARKQSNSWLSRMGRFIFR